MTFKGASASLKNYSTRFASIPLKTSCGAWVFALVTDDDLPTPIVENTPLGWMLLDIDYSGARPTPLFFDAKLENGSLAVPDPRSEEVRR